MNNNIFVISISSTWLLQLTKCAVLTIKVYIYFNGIHIDDFLTYEKNTNRVYHGNVSENEKNQSETFSELLQEPDYHAPIF